MSTHFHRKQVFIFALAMGLAAASYWIPLPSDTSIASSSSGTFGSMGQDTANYSRESATVWRFPVIVQMPQTPIETASTTQSVAERTAPALSPRLMNPQDFASDDRPPLLAPVKGVDLSTGR